MDVPILAHAVSRAAYEAKTVVAAHRLIAVPLARVRRRNHPIGRDTELVIEGFPRSASSFAVAAFRLAQRRDVVVGHHVHSPAQVIEAVRLGVPALVLVREPEEATLSFLVRRSDLTPRQALHGYVRYHQPLVPYRGRFVVGRFEDAITCFGDLVRDVNHLYGTDFVPFEHTPENVRTCMRTIERYVRRNHPPERFEFVVPRPSDERNRRKDELRPLYWADDLAGLRRKAEASYRALLPA